MGKRRFRNPESIQAERATWEAIPPFLDRLGFRQINSLTERNGLTVRATHLRVSRYKSALSCAGSVIAEFAGSEKGTHSFRA